MKTYGMTDHMMQPKSKGLTGQMKGWVEPRVELKGWAELKEWVEPMVQGWVEPRDEQTALLVVLRLLLIVPYMQHRRSP